MDIGQMIENGLHIFAITVFLCSIWFAATVFCQVRNQELTMRNKLINFIALITVA